MISYRVRFGGIEGGTVQFLPTVSTILFGKNVIEESLASEINLTGAHEILLITPNSMKSSKIVELIKSLLKDLTVNQISVSAEHVPIEALLNLITQIGEHKFDVVIALGGGSTIDLAKGLRVFNALGMRNHKEIVDFIHSPNTLDTPPCTQISIPTTLSGAEYTRSFSVTDFSNKKKLSLTESLCSSQTILYDPVATRDTPSQLWASSGVMALNHAIEVLVTSPPNMISDSLKLTSAANLLEHLPVSVGVLGSPNIDAAREFCQVASWMADHSPMRVRPRTSNPNILYGHALAYQIAAEYKVPYGLIAATTLVSCLRHYADRDRTLKNRIDQISSDLMRFQHNVSDQINEGESISLIDRVEHLIVQLSLPTRLRDVGVPKNGLDRLSFEFSNQNSHGSEPLARTLAERASQILNDAW